MIITTTPSVEGRAIREYKGIAFGEVITGVNVIKDLGAGLRNFFGGRSAGYEEELQKAREEALKELEQRAAAMGANAVIGVDIDYEVLGADAELLQLEQLAAELQQRSEEMQAQLLRTPRIVGPRRMLRAYPKLRHGKKLRSLPILREMLHRAGQDDTAQNDNKKTK